MDFKRKERKKEGMLYKILYHAIELEKLNKKKEHLWEVPTYKKKLFFGKKNIFDYCTKYAKLLFFLF